MFDVGPLEILVLIVVAILVFGPDRLPEFARQAGRMVRQLRNLAENAQNELRNELGPEYSDLKLTDLDPRRAIRKHILEAMDDDDEEPAAPSPGDRPLLKDERPPYDLDAT